MSAPAGRATVVPRKVAIDAHAHAATGELLRSLLGADVGARTGFAFHMRLFADAVFDALPLPPKGRIMVQEALSLDVREAIRVGDEVTVSGDRTSSPEAHVISLSAHRAAVDEPAARLTARLRLVEPNIVMAQAARGGRHPAEPVLSATLEAGHLAAYADLSGDTNPIHTDLAFARVTGLRERVVHGALLAFLVEPSLAAAGLYHPLRRMQMRFLGPAFAGEVLRLFVERAPDVRTNRARVTGIRPDGVICCVADAELAG